MPSKQRWKASSCIINGTFTDEPKLQQSRLDRGPALPSFESVQHREAPEGERSAQSIANVVILEGLALACEDVQIQALEVSGFPFARCTC